MADRILDDVEELLRRGRGDPEVLGRIRRAAERGEVISVYERGYVRELVESHLRPPPRPPAPKRPARARGPAPARPAAAQAPPAAPRRARLRAALTRRRLIVVAAAAALAAGAAAGALLQGADAPPEPPPPPAPERGFFVEAAAASYSAGDVISVHGRAGSGGHVDLAIRDPSGRAVWEERVLTRAGGEFSTLAIAGGPGWDVAGAYVIEAVQGGDAAQARMQFAG